MLLCLRFFTLSEPAVAKTGGGVLMILRCKITEKISYMQIYLQKNATLRMGYTRIYRSPGGRIFKE